MIDSLRNKIINEKALGARVGLATVNDDGAHVQILSDEMDHGQLFNAIDQGMADGQYPTILGKPNDQNQSAVEILIPRQ